MKWQIDRNSKIPIYKQIIQAVEDKIVYGEFSLGSLLPSERELSRQLNVNRMTIVRVYDELRSRGLIERKHGSGTRVSTNKWGTLQFGMTNWKKYLEGGAFLPMYPSVQKVMKERSNPDYYDLTSSDLSPELLPSELLKRALKDIQDQEQLFEAGFDHPQGHPPLRRTIAQYMQENHQVQTDESSIIVTSGINQSIYLITQSLLNPGDAVAIESPSYLYSIPLFQSVGLRVFALPIIDEHGINPEDIVELYRKHRIKMVFLTPTFQYPTGTILSESRRQRVAEISTELNIPIFEGDSNFHSSYTDQKINLIKSYDQHDNVIYESSVSKTISKNLGIGWICGPRLVVERLAEARQQMDFGVSIYPQLIANKLLQSNEYELHLNALRSELIDRRDHMVMLLKESLGDHISFQIPKGGFNIWCKINKPIDDKKLFDECFQNKVLVTPGSALGAIDGYIRLSFSYISKDKLEEAIQRLSKSIKSF